MQARRDRCAPRYGRRTVLGLALSPLLVGIARAEDETSKVDSGRLPPQPDDHFVFLTGPNKGQVVKARQPHDWRPSGAGISTEPGWHGT